MVDVRGVERKPLIGLRPLLGRLAPYRWQVVGALVAMAVSAAMVLAFGQGLKRLIDQGFSSANPALLNEAVLTV
ncbi:MAG TPA: ABC transporter, partial [Dongiaceae bacterium]|nr:ABC transporter [Dongiaceae bacterium]